MRLLFISMFTVYIYHYIQNLNKYFSRVTSTDRKHKLIFNFHRQDELR